MSIESLTFLDVLQVLLLTVLACTSWWLAVYALFPKFSERSSWCWEQLLSWRSLAGFVAGLLLLLPGGVLMLGGDGTSSDSSEFHWLGALLILSLILLGLASLLLGFAGFTGLALRLGNGLKSSRDGRHSWQSILWGSLVLGVIWGLLWLIFSKNDVNKLLLYVLLAAGLGNALLALIFRGEKPRSSRTRSSSPRGVARSARVEGERESADRRSRTPRHGRYSRSRDAQDESRRATGSEGSRPAPSGQ